jgi:hypothetical protein
MREMPRHAEDLDIDQFDTVEEAEAWADAIDADVLDVERARAARDAMRG